MAGVPVAGASSGCKSGQHDGVVLALGVRAHFRNPRILVDGDGEIHLLTFAMGVGIVCFYGIVGGILEYGGGEGFAFSVVLSVKPYKVGGSGIGTGTNGQCLSGADGFVAADGWVSRNAVDGDGHILASAFTVVIGYSCGYIVMGGLAQRNCSEGCSCMNGFSALGLGVPFVGSVRLRINDVQGESSGTAMDGVGYIRNGGGVNHSSCSHASACTGALCQSVKQRCIEVVFSND